MRCKKIVELLDPFRTGELETKESQAVAAHLAACVSCTGVLAEIKRLVVRAAALRDTAPEGLLESVYGRIADRYGLVETVLGQVWVAFSQAGISMVYLGGEDPDAFARAYLRRRGREALPGEVPKRYAQALQKAASGDARAGVPLDLTSLRGFERDVLQRLPGIPRGEVRPYQWLARIAGRPAAVRAVGNAMARNPLPLLLPCHRVVPAQGGVGNYAFGSSVKRDLLRREGAPLDELDALARRRVRYIGCKSTGVYCFPSCRHARRNQSANRVLFRSSDRAEEAGFRPCLHCSPRENPGNAA